MITKEQVGELIRATMQDCPLPSVVDMLMAVGPDDNDAEIMLGFIKAHYTRKQMRAGIDEYLERVVQMRRLFG